MLVEPRRGEFGRRTQFAPNGGAPFPPRAYGAPPPAGSERIVVSRWKMALLLLGSLVLLGAFFLTPMSAWSPEAWLGVAVFAAAAVTFVIGLVKPLTLELDSEGFTYAGGLTKTRRIVWRDVERFFLWKPPRGARMVAYKYVEGRRTGSILGKLNRLVGVDGSLPNLFPIKGEALVLKLETYRQRAVR